MPPAETPPAAARDRTAVGALRFSLACAAAGVLLLVGAAVVVDRAEEARDGACRGRGGVPVSSGGAGACLLR